MRNDTDIVFGNYFLECEMGFSHNWCHSVTSFAECEKEGVLWDKVSVDMVLDVSSRYREFERHKGYFRDPWLGF